MSDKTGDIVNKIVQANALENSGEVEAAIALYQEILELDRGGNYGDVAQKALDNLQKTTAAVQEASQKQSGSSWWSKLSIKAKTTSMLTGVALASTIGISIFAYVLADKTLTQKSNSAQQAESYALTKALGNFMQQRYGDISTLSNIGVVTDPELRKNRTTLQKRDIFNNYVQAYGLYSSITAFDLQGNAIASSTKKLPGNQLEQNFFQNVLSFNQPFVSKPIISQSTGNLEIRLAAPIKDTASGKTIGVMLAKMPLEKIRQIMISSEVGKKSYIFNNRGEIFLASDDQGTEQIMAAETQNIPLASRFDFHEELLQELSLRSRKGQDPTENKQSVLQGKQEVGYLNTFGELENPPDLEWNVVTTIDKDIAFTTQKQLLQAFIVGTLAISALVAIVARLIAEKATKPIIESVSTVEKIGQGDLSARVLVQGEDELADLGVNINTMAAQIQDLLLLQEEEAKRQRQDKERVQQGVMNLLLDVESAQKGDLTVKAKMTDGAVGSIADAFNATINKLRVLLQQVQTVSAEVGQLSLTGEDSVLQLSESALSQAEEINQAVSSIDEINQSVETVANYAQEAAQIARQGSIKAKEGDLAMDETVNSIEKIRTTVANTSKKVKQLAESSQEIAQIVEIISGISEKTNLLAFNASVEAARAGEHGEGFRIVAEEVRRLADRITEATKDIQQLVTTIQQDTGSVLQGMESSTSEVVNGSELIKMTKGNLRSLAETNKQIDDYLNQISTSTIEQTNTSQEVNQKINGIAVLAKANSTDAQSVVQALRTLVSEAEILQVSLSQFIL